MPLKVITWVILFLESTCWISVWFDEVKTDMISFMIVLHLVLELTTNRLCLNWLLIMGWVIFLVQADYMTPLDKRRFLRGKIPFRPPAPRVPPGIRGWVLKCFVLSFSLAILIDTFPARAITDKKYRLAFRSSNRRYLEPVLRAMGIWKRHAWNFYHVEPTPESSYYQAFIQLHNGTMVDRRSPTWRTLQWWERKRATRLMKFFANFAASNQTILSYTEHIVDDITNEVAAVQLVRLVRIYLVVAFACVSFAHIIIDHVPVGETTSPSECRRLACACATTHDEGT